MLLFRQCGSDRVDIKMWNVRGAQLHMAVTDMVKAKEFYTERCEKKCRHKRVTQAMRIATAQGLQKANVGKCQLKKALFQALKEKRPCHQNNVKNYSER